MPIPESRLYNAKKLNLWFAASSVVMTASIVWMVYIDYDRPWHAYQDNYYLSKAALAHLDYVGATRQERLDEIEEARARRADAEEYAARTVGARRERLAEQLAQAELQFKRFDDAWSRTGQVLEVTRDTYERARGQFGPDAPSTLAAHANVTVEEEEEERLRKQQEQWGDKKKLLEQQIQELDAPVRAARKRLQELEDVARAALVRDRKFRGMLVDEGLLGDLPIVRMIINMPLLDFAAPKNTPGRYQVNQLVLPDVRQRLNYLDSYTTDRCTTCHVAIDDPEFSQDRLAQKLERALPGINEARRRAGDEPLEFPVPPVIKSGEAALPTGRVTEHWDELSSEQQESYFSALLSLVNSYLEQSGRKTIDLGQPLLAHPDLDLYVSIDSPHPMARLGCTVCHEGNPQETDFVLAAHTPPTHEIEEKWREEYYVRMLGLPTHTFETVSHYWDRPMRLPKYTEAGCAKCHNQITDISRFRGDRKGVQLNLGRYLFTNVGCVNCHGVDELAGARRVGPDLSRMASKLKPEFVQQWVSFPQKFRPSTRMPHFFRQENNRSASANKFDSDPVLRTETEVAAISRYLSVVSQPWKPIEKPAEIVGNAERGRQTFRKIGCTGCHANVTEFGEEWITEDLIHRLDLDETTARHRYRGMTHAERVRYAMSHFTNERDTFLHPERARFDPEQEYQPPVLTRFAPELSGIGSKVTFEWLYSWLIDPTQYAPETKMPSLRLTPAEAADLAAYLMTLKQDSFDQRRFEMNPARQDMVDELVFTLLSAQRSERRSRAIMKDEDGELTKMLVSLTDSSVDSERVRGQIEEASLRDRKLIFLGHRMISHYGCYACHRIPGFERATPPGTDLSGWAEKPVTQLDFAFYDDAFHEMREEKQEVYGYVYPRDSDELNRLSPIDDLAREQITHTHAAFAKHKLLNPRLWDREKIRRPYDKLKMPNFYFTEEEADALTTFLLSRVPPRVNDSLRIDYETTLLGHIAVGRNLTRELNCLGCHEIEDNAPTIQQYFRRKVGSRTEFDSINSPPSLWGEGAKVQHHWLHRFLQDVEPLRPWLQVRMPSFNLTGEEATVLAEYFAALSQQDSVKLGAALEPINEFQARAQSDSTSASNGGSGDDPGTEWFREDYLSDAAAALRRFAVQRKLIRPGAVDPLVSSSEEVEQAHAKLLERVRFVQELYDVEYPFVEPPTPLSPDDRFELGSRFLEDMGCLKCHVLGRMLPGPAKNTDDFVQTYRLDGVRGEGDEAVAVLNGRPYPIGSVIDGHTLVEAQNVYYETGDVETKAIIEGPSAEGQTERIMLQAPSAPNLLLTHQRLRREWVFNWMLAPGLIQPGTKMPQNFPNGQSPFAGDPHYPGSGPDHIDLLVDYLYDAGTRGVRAPLPKIVAAEEGEAEEFDEEEFDD